MTDESVCVCLLRTSKLIRCASRCLWAVITAAVCWLAGLERAVITAAADATKYQKLGHRQKK